MHGSSLCLTLPLPHHRLNQVCGGRPAYVTRHDSHLGVANSAALARADITAATPDPDGGTVDRDPATGQPTGILRWERLQGLRNLRWMRAFSGGSSLKL